MDQQPPTGLPPGQLTVLAAAALDGAGDLIGFLGVDGAVLYANRAACAELQLPVELVLRATIFDFLPALTPELWQERWHEFRAGGRLRFTDRMRRRDGTLFPVEVHASLVVFAGGEFALVVARDATKHRRAELALRESAEAFRALTENNPSMVTRWGRDHRILYANPSAVAFSGRSIDEVIGHTGFELLPDADLAARIDDTIERVFREGAAAAIDLVLGERAFDWRVAPELSEQGEVVSVLGVSTEITEQKALERKLRDSRDFIAQVIASAEEGIIVLDRELRYVLRNRFMEELTGIPSDDLYGVCIVERPVPHLPELIRSLERALAGETVRSRDVMALVSPGLSETWIQTTYSPLRDPSGAITGVILIVHDVTARRAREQEQRELELRMLEAQRLESLGVLAGGIAHDFNNLLVGILGNASAAGADAGSSEQVRERLGEIELAARRAADLTRQLLAYAGRGRVAVVPLDLSELVSETIDLVRIAIPRSVGLDVDLQPGLPAVVADRAQLQQVAMNLVINAGEAVGTAEGAVRISTCLVELTGAELTGAELAGAVMVDGEIAPGRYVVLDVTDSGTGMDGETVASVFEPFFSTKGPGRGLGLSSVLGIVRSSRGAIRVESVPGRGTTFRVFLPAAAEVAWAGATPMGASLAGSDAPPPQAAGTVLVVEDEELVARTVLRILEAAGHSVILAGDGRAALAAFRERSDEVQAVVLDLAMPGLGGAATYHELRALAPLLPILVTSGYADGEPGMPPADDAHAAFLAKPYVPAALVAALARLLGPVETR